MDDDSHVIDKGWDALPEYAGDVDDAVTISISTTPGEWLVNTVDAVVVPMSMAEVVEGLRAGSLTERSLVWRQGMQEWSHIASVPQLKLAARLPQQSTRPRTEKPSAPPARPAPVAQMLSRRSTLPFGLTAPPGSRPAHAKPTRPPSASAPPPGDDSEVLAVYARPAATISFDLSPEQPLRAPPPKISTPAPQTLAPTTSDSSPRNISPYRSSDLSVVAARDYRAVQRSGKRMVLVWSLASAAAASVLTFWLARTGASSAPAAARPPEAAVSLPAATPPNAPPPPVVEVAAAPTPAPESVPSASATPKPLPAAPAVRRARKPALHQSKPVAAVESDERAAPAPNVKDPSSEPNPYDVKLDDDTATAKPPSIQSSGLDDAPGSEASAASDKKITPGF